MDNNVFLNKLIMGTKQGKILWADTAKNRNFLHYDYFAEKGDSFLALVQSQEETTYGTFETCYTLSIFDSNFNCQYSFHQDDFKRNGADLIRLYRLVERNVNDVDSRMSQIVGDIEDLDF